MPKYDFNSELKKLSLSIIEDEKFQTEKVNLFKKENPPEQLVLLPPSVKDFYSHADGYQLQWSHRDFEGDRFARGQVNIMHLEEVLHTGEDILWFSHTPAKDPIRNFRIIDYVSDEVFVGAFIGNARSDSLYFYNISDEPVSLQLNMQGYVTMLCGCRGFRFWQLSVLSILRGKEYPESTTMKKYLPQLIPGFSFADFEKLFSTVKIK